MRNIDVHHASRIPPINSLALFPGRHWDPHFTYSRLRWRYDGNYSVLNLDRNHRFDGIFAGVIKVDRAIEGNNIQVAQCLAHCIHFQTIGLLNGQMQR